MDLNKINSYISSLYERKEELNKKEFISKTQLKDFIPVVDDDVARLLKLIIRITRPMRILEIGTSIGYSTVSMAQIVKEYGGLITTIEYDEKVALQAKANFINAGVEEYIKLKLGDARRIILNLDEEYDLIFQDVDKKLYPLLFNDCIRKLKTGGLLIAEDTLFPVLSLEAKWQDLIEPIKQFNELVVNCPELDSTLLPVGDGVIIAVKK